MEADELDEDLLVPDANDTLSATGVTTAAIPADPVAPVVEAAKVCCICGMDVSQSKRRRDSANRYWCVHCNDFIRPGEKRPGSIACHDCGREYTPMLLIDSGGEKVCKECNDLHLAEAPSRKKHKAAVSANPETEIRKVIRKMALGILAAIVLSVLVCMYHAGFLYVKPASWVPFMSAVYLFGIVASGLVIAIGFQFSRIAVRQKQREGEYDQMIRAAANQILAIEDESHSMGINESPEPLRRAVERAVSRVEAKAGEGDAHAAEILDTLAKKGNPEPVIRYLLTLRPGTIDTAARNREIATISYLYGNFEVSRAAVMGILLRIHHDPEAMTRRALIYFRTGDFEHAKKEFVRVVNTAKERKSEIDLADGYRNLGMLHTLMSEWDDANVRYNQSLQIYERLKEDVGQADCLLSMGLIAYRAKKGLEVEHLFRRAMTINKSKNRREALSISCGVLGAIQLEKEPPDLKEGEKLLSQALDLNLELGRPTGVAAAYGNLGMIRIKQRNFSSARDNFLKAQSIYQRLSRPKQMAKIQEMLKTVSKLSAASAR